MPDSSATWSPPDDLGTIGTDQFNITCRAYSITLRGVARMGIRDFVKVVDIRFDSV
jgi:hypothetical protein